jgi:predicted phage terminase large subunit-like protein
MAKGLDETVFILDLIRGRWQPEETLDIIAATAADDGYAVDVVLEEERGSSGRLLNQSIRHRLETAGIGGQVHSERITGSKEARAYGLAGAVGAGNVVMVEADWNDDLRRELDVFPLSGEHDDIVDALSLAFGWHGENPQVLGSAYFPGQDGPQLGGQSRW